MPSVPALGFSVVFVAEPRCSAFEAFGGMKIEIREVILYDKCKVMFFSFSVKNECVKKTKIIDGIN